MNQLIDKAIGAMGNFLSKPIKHAKREVTVNAPQAYSGAYVMLERNTEYLILTNTITNNGAPFTVSTYCVFTAGVIDSCGSNARTNTGSGQGVTTWYWVKTGEEPVMATAHCYGYNTTSHTETTFILAIPLFTPPVNN